MTTPIWVPLVVALLGLGGIFLTQYRADRREDARWQREREREQALWAREDAARSYEHRLAAYVDFLTVFREQWDRFCSAIEASGGEHISEPMENFLDPLLVCLAQVRMFGTNEAAQLATDAYGSLANAVSLTRAMWGDVLQPLEAEIRRDLSIPDRIEGQSSETTAGPRWIRAGGR